jgi:hypothetical protein
VFLQQKMELVQMQRIIHSCSLYLAKRFADGTRPVMIRGVTSHQRSPVTPLSIERLQPIKHQSLALLCTMYVACCQSCNLLCGFQIHLLSLSASIVSLWPLDFGLPERDFTHQKLSHNRTMVVIASRMNANK